MMIDVEKEYIEGKVKGYQFKVQINDIILSRSIVKDEMERLELPFELLANPTPKRAVCRAASEAAKTNRRFKDHLSRKIVDNSDKMVIGIVDENRLADVETLSYEQSTTIRFNKESNKVSADGYMSEEFYKHYAIYSGGITGRDIIDSIYRIMRIKGNSIALINSGHLYFVPFDKRHIISKIEQLINSLNIGMICCCEIIDSENSNSWIWDSAKTTIETNVSNIMRTIGNIDSRASTLNKKSIQLSDASSLLRSYATLTGFGAEIENTLESIDNATSKIAYKLSLIAKKQEV